MKIHEFIEKLIERGRIADVESYNTTDDIVATLKRQFAGLFQNLLQKEASLTEQKTAYDLQQSVDYMRTAVKEFEARQEEFFKKFDSTIYSQNYTLWKIRNHLNLRNSSFYAKNIEALDDFMKAMLFDIMDVDDSSTDVRKYSRETYTTVETLILKKELIAADGTFLDIRSKEKLESLILFESFEKPYSYATETVFENDDEDLPF